MELDDSQITNLKIFKIHGGARPPFSKSFFGHNSAADRPISVKFCTGKQNSMAIEVT